MANDCLVTKLKGIVSNNRLPKLGELSIDLAAHSGKSRVELRFNAPVTLTIIGGGKFYTSSSGSEIGNQIEETATYAKDYYIGNTTEGDKLVISNKYAIVRLKFVEGSTFFKGNSVLDCDYLPSLQMLNTFTSKIEIDANKLSKNAKDLSIFYALDNTLVSGEIETIVENILSLGRNDGTLSITAYLSYLKLNGNRFFVTASDRLKEMTITFGNNSASCVWKGNTIASYDGSTWSYNI